MINALKKAYAPSLAGAGLQDDSGTEINLLLSLCLPCCHITAQISCSRYELTPGSRYLLISALRAPLPRARPPEIIGGNCCRKMASLSRRQA
jgi:hypothetical protein